MNKLFHFYTSLALVWSLMMLEPTCTMAQDGPGGIDSNLDAWFKADVGVTTSGTDVTQWSDQSGNSNDATPGDGSTNNPNNPPSLQSNVINGQPIIRFDEGPDDSDGDYDSEEFLTISNLTTVNTANSGGDQLSIIAVALRPSGSSPQATGSNTANTFITIFSTAEIQMLAQLRGSGNSVVNQWGTTLPGGSSLSSGQTLGNNFIIMTMLCEDNASDVVTAEFYTNGGNNANATGGNYRSGVGPRIGINESSPDQAFNGDLAEVIYYAGGLEEVERIIIENYLSAKYDITLSSNDVYVGDNSGNGDYDLEVIGIGQSSGITHTSSQAAGLAFTVSSGLDNDGEYFLAGHSESSNAVNNTDVSGISGGSGNEARWSRTWYGDLTETNNNLTLDLTFDMSEAGLPTSLTSASASDYVIITRAPATTTWSELTATATISGDQVAFTGVDAEDLDGVEFTLGTQDASSSPLPVELTGFTAQWEGGQALLEWETASELHNSHFDIQRSIDGNRWDVIGQVEGHGTTNQAQHYQFLDGAAAAAAEGRLFYRLQQFDFDGTNEFSPVVSLTPEDQTIEEPGRAVTGYLQEGRLMLEQLPAGPHALRLYNAQGQEVHRWAPFRRADAGSQRLDWPGHLSKGLYFLSDDAAQRPWQLKLHSPR